MIDVEETKSEVGGVADFVAEDEFLLEGVGTIVGIVVPLDNAVASVEAVEFVGGGGLDGSHGIFVCYACGVIFCHLVEANEVIAEPFWFEEAFAEVGVADFEFEIGDFEPRTSVSDEGVLIIRFFSTLIVDEVGRCLEAGCEGFGDLFSVIEVGTIDRGVVSLVIDVWIGFEFFADLVFSIDIEEDVGGLSVTLVGEVLGAVFTTEVFEIIIIELGEVGHETGCEFEVFDIIIRDVGTLGVGVVDVGDFFVIVATGEDVGFFGEPVFEVDL